MDKPRKESLGIRRNRSLIYLGAGLLSLTALGGCSSESEVPASLEPDPRTSIASDDCQPENSASEMGYGIHYGLDLDELQILIGERGATRQAAAWQRIEEEVQESLEEDTTPQGEFVVNAGVAFDQMPEARADSQAQLLARLASQELSLPEGNEPDKGYHGQDGLATIHVELPGDSGPATSDRCRV